MSVQCSTSKPTFQKGFQNEQCRQTLSPNVRLARPLTRTNERAALGLSSTQLHGFIFKSIVVVGILRLSLVRQEEEDQARQHKQDEDDPGEDEGVAVGGLRCRWDAVRHILLLMFHRLHEDFVQHQQTGRWNSNTASLEWTSRRN